MFGGRVRDADVRGAAAPDAEPAEPWRANVSQRHTVQLRFAGVLVAKTGGALRDGHDAGSAADVAAALLGPETYALPVGGRGWAPEC